ncbi:TRAP transporter small permease [Phyllobacterium leguminum]|uniref:TRAP transporter small permease protein n=1 Tax=Phyllobacterium leguminum TaxID=314237 RepID=A0A318T7E2_9HYPH|nr:TRAP transporter small permease [Phyllobacterium leguminum]PYE90483.1 TRAP-type C4-dicarboxylate transport system permease small subunit [Phyllobacterium leguminum]
MSHFMQTVRPTLAWLSRASLYTAGAGIVAMTAIVGWQVFARYMLNDTPSWAEPLSLRLMSWFIMLGAAVGVRESVHLGLDFVRHAASPAIQRIMDLIGLGLIILFGLAMTFYSVKLAAGTWTATIPVLGWPGGVDFFPMIIGGLLISLFAAERFADVAAGSQAVAANVIVQEAA